MNFLVMILIDFDGTIIDLWPRYHAVFCDLTENSISLSEYRKLKQHYKKDELLAHTLGLKLPTDYFIKKALLLEDCYYLSYDKLLIPKDSLLRLFNQSDTIILTKRRNPENFIWELDYLGLSDIRFKAICTKKSKLEWAKENVTERSIIIGDDVRDLQVAILKYVDAIMVLTGLGTSEDYDALNIPYMLYGSLDDYINNEIFRV